MSNYGNTQIYNQSTNPSQDQILVEVSSGDGSLSSLSGNSYQFTMGLQTSIVTATCNGASASVTFSDPYHFVRTETTLTSVLTPSGSTCGVAQGTMQSITLNVTYSSVQVYEHGNGNVQHRNPTAGAAAGAGLTYTVTADGAVTPMSGTTDQNGNFTNTFTMGFEDREVRVDVLFGGGSGFATLGFTAEVLELVREDTFLSVALSAPNGNQAPAGESRGALLYVTVDTQKVYRNSQGMEVIKDQTSGPAMGAGVTFSIINGGDASVSGASSTDSSGNATATVTLGTVSSTLEARATFNNVEVTTTLDFVPTE